jgi:hypothetical protein
MSLALSTASLKASSGSMVVVAGGDLPSSWVIMGASTTNGVAPVHIWEHSFHHEAVILMIVISPS